LHSCYTEKGFVGLLGLAGEGERMSHPLKRVFWLAGCIGLASLAPLHADPPVLAKRPAVRQPASGPSFIRVKRDDKQQPVALEVAIAHYAPVSGAGGLELDLIGAVHVGDRAYYEQLNRQFENYDVVLYELVAPPGTRVPKGGKKSDNPIALLQQLATVVLDLEFQLEQIDYTKQNFVHADLSPDGMAKAMRERGETGLTLFLGIAGDIIRQYNLQEAKRLNDKGGGADLDLDSLANLLFDPDAPGKLKRMMAQQLADLGSPAGGLGPTLTNLLVKDRNQAAMQVFQKQLTKGRKKIAIFYGVAHLPDFDRRLREEFDLKRTGENWLTAWDLRPKSKGLENLLKLFGS
jgi:hypothetical protein